METERPDAEDWARPQQALRVLHLITDLGKGGAERFLLDLCTALQGRPGVEILIGTLFQNDQYREQSAGLPVVNLDFKTFSFRDPPPYDEYARLLDRFCPHVIHTHRFLAEFLSSQHLRSGVAYVCHGHDNMIQLRNLSPGSLLGRRAFTNWLEKRYLVQTKYRRVRTSFIANSQHTLRYYQRVLPRAMRNDVHLIPYGFDFQRFASPTPRSLEPGRPLRLVNVGSFQAKKNQIFIVRVAEAMREAGMDFQIDLLGDGEHRGQVREAVKRAGLEDAVRFHGIVDRVEEWLWKCDLYLHTAWYEPFGLVLLEAMAAGLPCVVLDGKGNRDIIEEGRNGYLLEREEAGAFVERIREVVHSPDRYMRMSDYAMAFARRYDMEQAANRFLAFYHSFLHATRRSGEEDAGA